MPELKQPNWEKRKDVPKQSHTNADPPKDCKCGVEDLRAEAAEIKPTFDAIFDYLQKLCEPSTDPIPQQKKATDDRGAFIWAGGIVGGRHVLTTVEVSPTSKASNKGAFRIAQKCFTKYKNLAEKSGISPLAYINDVVRATMAFNNCTRIIKALEKIEEYSGRDLDIKTTGGAPKYAIVRVKQIYSPRSPLLYGDIKLNLRVTNEANPNGHNCELQLNLVSMLKGKGTHDGHGAYEDWRRLEDDHWLNEGTALPPELKNQGQKYQARAERIVFASQHAYLAGAIQLDKDGDYKNLLAMVEKMSKGLG